MRITRRQLRKLVESAIFNEGIEDLFADTPFEDLTPEQWEEFNNIDPTDEDAMIAWAENSNITI